MKRAEPGWLVLALAGIAAAIGSFRPFYTFSGGIDLTVWNRSLFPTATLIPALLVGIGLEALFVLLMGHEPRSPFLNFTWAQARLAGSAFAIVLVLGYLVQGRAGASLGAGYFILSLSTLATFGGAVMTRRAELARGHEEIVKTEHPWRAAVLRWRREMTAKVQEYASGGSQGAPTVQPVSDGPSTQTPREGGEGGDEAPDEEREEPTPEPSPVVRLSAVHSEPEPKTDSDEKSDDETEEKAKAVEQKPSPLGRNKPAKAAAKKTVPQKAEGSVGDAAPVNDGEAEGGETSVAEASGGEASDGEANAGEPKVGEAGDSEATESEASGGEATGDEAEAPVEEERERPAAPG